MLYAQDMKDTTSGNVEYETFGSGGPVAGGATGITSIMVDKLVEFLYEELANATDNFNVANKIVQGGFGAIYYEKLRGKKVAIKKMEMKASKEFIAEVKVLMNVHHLIVLISSTNVLACYIFDPRGLLIMVTMVYWIIVSRKESLSSVLLTLSTILVLQILKFPK
ncbi:hypothetical protein L6164_002618 [Bauhinia variegata]|uniref:Uncharacterized protein n=1 Tax=Bauhinia variegata TaxID=167791 RepID=A0ACB9Q0W5_BAUVA|nr:hypothetical protein L6164_002618 [Bauhinia variegata]